MPTRITDEDYRALAAFRHALRRFVAFSEDAARHAGLTPQQHQAILAIRAEQETGAVSVGDLAARLLIRHHSAVELADRLEQSGLVRRQSAKDKRRVMLTLTPKAEAVLAGLSAAHMEELRTAGPALAALLGRLSSSR